MAYKVACGVPTVHCGGATLTYSHAVSTKLSKVHADHEEAFKCYKRYLISQGFEQIGNREFRDPNGGPIRLLSKKSKFGVRLRLGKNDKGIGNRYMPKSGGEYIQTR